MITQTVETKQQDFTSWNHGLAKNETFCSVLPMYFFLSILAGKMFKTILSTFE